MYILKYCLCFTIYNKYNTIKYKIVGETYHINNIPLPLNGGQEHLGHFQSPSGISDRGGFRQCV